MANPLLAPLLAFLITAAAIALLRPLALRIGLTDKPDARKKHIGEIPLVGGLAIFAGAAVTLYGALVFGQPIASTTGLFAWSGACVLLIAVGVADDMKGLSPGIRFAAEIVAVLIMIYGGGTLLTDLGRLYPDEAIVSLSWLAAPFTVFAAVGVINAFNMSDGLDGLSGNLALVTLLAFGIADGLWGNADRLGVTNVISAAVAGFLLFNQRMLWQKKAMVFLGDAGSMMLGLTLVWGIIDMSQGDNRALSPAAALWFLMIPIYDTVRLMIRRLLRGGSPFAADTFHLHHLLIRAGFSVSEAIALICLSAAAGAGIGLLCHGLRLPEFTIAVAYTLLAIMYYVLVERAWRTGSLFGRPLVSS